MYCNLMYTIATHLIETKSGLSFTQFLQQRFFDPLGMTSTYLQPEPAIAAGCKDLMASFYVWDEERQAFKDVAWEQTPEDQGAGSIFTSVNDYIKWVRCVMNRQAPITPEIYKGLLKPRTIVEPEAEANDELEPFYSAELYAAGWGVAYYRGYKIVIHDGQIAGSGSCHFFLPHFKFGAVILANSDQAGTLGEVIAKVLVDEVIGVPEAERVDWSAVMKEAEAKYEVKRHEEIGRKLPTSPHESPSQPSCRQFSLEKYTGRYHNVGYHNMDVEIKDGTLFIDATDRSMGLTLTFEHVRDETAFIAHVCDWQEGADEPFAAEFRMEEGRVSGMGIKLEDDLDEFIWFDKIGGSSQRV